MQHLSSSKGEAGAAAAAAAVARKGRGGTGLQIECGARGVGWAGVGTRKWVVALMQSY